MIKIFLALALTIATVSAVAFTANSDIAKACDIEDC